jgi:serine/threonine protein kinase
MILGLEYLHANNIIHLDIRPENLVLDDKGYIRIVNYLSAQVKSAKEKEKKIEEIINENPIYMAPEILHG